MNYTDYILNLPESTEFDLLPETTREFISQLSPEWPSFPMLNTKVVGGRKLIHVRMAVQLTKAQLEDMFVYFGLDWLVVGIRSAEPVDGEYVVIHHIDKAAFVPFWNDIVTDFDVTGTPITRSATVNDTIYLSTYAGTDPIEL
jgi:hypothetical protein